MAQITIQDLLEAGAHFGHQTQRWNPKVRPYIFDQRNGIYIIDLQKTEPLFRKAADFVREAVAHGGDILYVGTKRQAQEIVIREARRAGMPYAAFRWVGGMLTNFAVIRRSVERLAEIEALETGGGWARIPPKEQSDLKRQKENLFRLYNGMRLMKRLPAAIFVVDAVREDIAVLEANSIGVPVVAILDTNCDPDLIQYPIPGNDDAIRAIQLFTSAVTDAALAGLAQRREMALEAEKKKSPQEEQFYLGRSVTLSRSMSTDDDMGVDTESAAAPEPTPDAKAE